MRIARTHPLDWTAEQRAEWVTAWLNERPGLLPVPFHPPGECRFCDVFHALIEEAAEAREVKHA